MNILQKHTKNGINLKTNDMKTKLIIQRFTDEKYGKRLRIMTPSALIGVMGEDGAVEFMTVLPVPIDVLTQILCIGQNFSLFYDIQKDESHVS